MCLKDQGMSEYLSSSYKKLVLFWHHNWFFRGLTMHRGGEESDGLEPTYCHGLCRQFGLLFLLPVTVHEQHDELPQMLTRGESRLAARLLEFLQ